MSLDIKDIKIVESETFVMALFDFLFLILPGTAIIYVFNNSLFQSLDWIKLILLSGSITAPLILINTFLIAALLISKESSGNTLFIDFSLSLFITGLLLFSVIAVNYFFGRSFRTGMIFLASVEILFLIIGVIKISNYKKAQ